MNDSQNKPMLPCICPDGSFEDHLQSLNHIKGLDLDSVLLSHGQAIWRKEAIDQALDMRRNYLKSVVGSGGAIDIKEALGDRMDQWSFTHWHKSNLKHL